MSRPLVIAHRGASSKAPENTCAAFQIAWEQGADAIETDLRLTADGTVVAFHDSDGRRILGTSRRLQDMTFEQLQNFDAGRWRGRRWTGMRVPSLKDVLQCVPPDRHLVLELKEGLSLVDGLARELKGKDHARITLIAFDAETIVAAHDSLPDCRALWLFKDYASLPRKSGEWLAARVKDLGLDGVDLRYERRLTEPLVSPLRESGCTIFTYTVNSSRALARCTRLGLHGVTTDRPAAAIRWLSEISA